MKLLGERVICSECGSDDMRVAAGVLAECRKCGLGMLIREFPQWKDDYKKLPNMEKLSEAYKKAKHKTFAYCSNCRKVYEDDLPICGSLYCPNEGCGGDFRRFCIVRGLKEIPPINSLR